MRANEFVDQNISKFGPGINLWTEVSQNLVQESICGPKYLEVWSRKEFVDQSRSKLGSKKSLPKIYRVSLTTKKPAPINRDWPERLTIIFLQVNQLTHHLLVG